MIRKAYKFKFRGSRKLSVLYGQTGCCRFVWNRALAIQKEHLEKKEKLLSYKDLCKELTKWKTLPETSFLKDSANAQALQQELKDLDRAFKDAFDKRQPHKTLPVFKKKGKCTESIRIPVAPKINGNTVFIPKIGWCRFFKSREIKGKIKNCTISNKCGDWFISFQVEMKLKKDSKKEFNNPVGIDAGIKRTATLSTGKVYDLKNTRLNCLEAEKKKIQRSLSRKQKGGSNWNKAKQMLSEISNRITLIRNDFLHKASTEIVKNHDFVCVEALNVKRMSRSAKGTVEKPGKDVKKKASLNRAILSQGWGEFHRQLSYKLSWRNGLLVEVDPLNTSRTCSKCGHVEKDNRKNQANFECLKCGFKENADLNAAINILRVGQAPLGDMGGHKAA